jgi:hypothetical protein
VDNKRVVKTRGFSATRKLTSKDAPKGFNGVIFGPPGVGKTTLAMTLQGSKYGGNVLLHDADRGRESVLDVEDAEFYVPEDWKELRSNLDTALALKGDTPFQTHVFDSVTLLWDLCMKHTEKMNPNVRDPRQNYFAAQKDFLKFVDDSVTLTEYGINTLFVGHMIEDKSDEDGPTVIRLDLPPKTRGQFLLRINHIGFLERAKRGEDRVLHLKPPNSKTEGPKVRQTRTGEQLPLEIINPNLGDILTQLRTKGVK